MSYPSAAYQPYNFGLDKHQEDRAEQLHRDSIVLDLLWHGPYGSQDYNDSMSREFSARLADSHSPLHTAMVERYLPQAWASKGKFPEFRALWEASGVTGGGRMVEFSTWELFASTMGIHQQLFDTQKWVIKALCAADIRLAKESNRRCAWLHTQLDTGVCENFIELLPAAYGMGLRIVQLTYNSMNLLGVGCTERTDGGVSKYGARAIERMNELGVIVDTGHCGHKTTLDACAVSSAPVIASHTCVRALSDVPRAKKDEELDAIAATGGVIGVMAVPLFLSEQAQHEVPLEVWLDHIDYLCARIGWQHVSIGTDWPMQVPVKALKEMIFPNLNKIGHQLGNDSEKMLVEIAGFKSYLDFPNLTRGLVSRGYSDEAVAGILGENFLRVFEAVCG